MKPPVWQVIPKSEPLDTNNCIRAKKLHQATGITNAITVSDVTKALLKMEHHVANNRRLKGSFNKKLAKRPISETQIDFARVKTFFPLSPFRGGIFTPRFKGNHSWGHLTATYVIPGGKCFISFSRGDRYIRKACSAADNKNRLFPRGPASLSLPSPTFVPPIKDLAASEGRKIMEGGKKKGENIINLSLM
ncbi:hypothetical protein CEXT_12311 [Caerostris extrusa]|uniref:Uncharacterized protein n=1 Tax=Caerostris extrusa TaxID=172846 RepID=A0AAV4QML5_CAEEX|nr:hypothetical protein CEXT_12311 [Caerostris extrusa]